MRTTVDLPPDLLRAAADGETLKSFFTRVVAQALATSPGTRPHPTRVSLPLVGSGPSTVQVTNDVIADVLAAADVDHYGEP